MQVEETFSQVTSDAAHGYAAYADCVGCLTSFARNRHRMDVSLESVRLMPLCTQITLRAQGATQGPGIGGVLAAVTSERGGAVVAASTNIVFTDSEEHVRLWFPVLTGLGGLAADGRLQHTLRTASLGALFSILMSYGHHFSSNLWGIVSQGVLMPLFEDVHHIEEIPDTTCVNVVSLSLCLCLLFYVSVSCLLCLCVMCLTTLHLSPCPSC